MYGDCLGNVYDRQGGMLGSIPKRLSRRSTGLLEQMLNSVSNTLAGDRLNCTSGLQHPWNAFLSPYDVSTET